MYQDRNSGPSQKIQGNWQCSDCGTAITELPFEPEGDRPIRCRDCHRVFQLTYTYEARKPGIKELITEMAFNGAGVRDTARTLKIGINTVIRTLKNSRQSE